MDADRVHAALPDPPSQGEEDNKEEEKAFGNTFAELESVDLPLGTTLRYIFNCQNLFSYFNLLTTTDSRLMTYKQKCPKRQWTSKPVGFLFLSTRKHSLSLRRQNNHN